MLRRLVLGIGALKAYRPLPKHIFSRRVVTRYFHFALSHRSCSGFGNPCLCSNCQESAKELLCQICRARPYKHQSWDSCRDRKGSSGYGFHSYCEECWEGIGKRLQQEERKKEEILNLRHERIHEMMQAVRKVELTEQVPITYAVGRVLSDADKASVKHLFSRRYHQHRLITQLSNDLQIVKVRNRFKCNKSRVDALDFGLLWFS